MAKLELALLVGGESKQWLSDLTLVVDRLEAALQKTGGNAAPAIEEKEEPKAETKKPKAKKEDPKAEAKNESADDFLNDVESSTDLDEPTLTDVRKAVKDFAAKHGKEKAMKLLGKFKVTSTQDLKESQYPEIIELVNKHL